MRKYTAYITPQTSRDGKSHTLVTNSKLEGSIYAIEGYKPTLLDLLVLGKIPRNEKKFQEVVWKTFSKKQVVLDDEVENFCRKYNFTFEKLSKY